MLKAVLFDLDDTLYNTTKQVTAARKNAARKMVAAGLLCDEAKALSELSRIADITGPNYQKHFNDLIKRLSMPPNPKIVAAGVIGYHDGKRRHLKPYPCLKRELTKLRGAGFRLGIVSDGVQTKQWEKIMRLGIDGFFDAVVISEEESQNKPSAKPFLKAAKILGVKPSECVVVGDRVDRDVAGAHNAGMKAIQVLSGRHSKDKPGKKAEIPDLRIKGVKGVSNAISRLD